MSNVSGGFRVHDNHINLDLKEKDSILDVDDAIVSATRQQPQVSGRGSKMQHANEVAAKTEKELRELCEGLNNRIAEIGLVVASAQHYQGSEKFYNALGKFGIRWAKNKADVHRHDRLQTLNLDDAVKEIQHYVKETILQLGESEQEYKLDLQKYKDKIDEVMSKLTMANPKYLDAMTRRQQLETEVQSLEEEIKAGTLSQLERPAKQKALEDKQRLLDSTLLEEKTLAAVVKEAQEALPELQKSRTASSQSIQSLHSMRQAMLEKFENLRVVLERATTAMKARAKAELYSSVDPAFNKSIEVITENNVATAGALLETWAERIKHAAIDPEASQRLLNELLSSISDAAKDLTEVEDKIKSGPGSPIPYSNGEDKEE